jgi:hypothetical protein
VDGITSWLIALVVVFVLGMVGTSWAIGHGRGVIWIVWGLTLAALGGLLILGYHWAITEGHLTG